MSTLVKQKMESESFKALKDMFMLKMKEMADKHSEEPVRYFVVITPDGNDTIFKNRLFKVTSKYDLWLQVNKSMKLFHYDENFVDMVLYEILSEKHKGDDFDYWAVTPEQKVDELIKYSIISHNEGFDYDCDYWVEVKLD